MVLVAAGQLDAEVLRGDQGARVAASAAEPELNSGEDGTPAIVLLALIGASAVLTRISEGAILSRQPTQTEDAVA